jgi:paraquat-inducible protein A
MNAAAALIACHECDLLQRERALPDGGKALCARCGALLYRSHPHATDRALAFALAGVVLFAIANSFPIVSLELSGERVDATLYGAVRHLYGAAMPLLAALVFVTMILMPAVELAAMCYLLLPLRLGRVPRLLAPALRALQGARPWAMVEVFVLGVLVTVVKLGHLAHAVPGIALWSFGALMLAMAAARAAFEPRELWGRA